MIYFSQSQLLFAKTNERRTTSRKALFRVTNWYTVKYFIRMSAVILYFLGVLKDAEAEFGDKINYDSIIEKFYRNFIALYHSDMPTSS